MQVPWCISSSLEDEMKKEIGGPSTWHPPHPRLSYPKKDFRFQPCCPPPHLERITTVHVQASSSSLTLLSSVFCHYLPLLFPPLHSLHIIPPENVDNSQRRGYAYEWECLIVDIWVGGRWMVAFGQYRPSQVELVGSIRLDTGKKKNF